MADLARAVSAASTLDQLLPAVARRAQRLLGAAACEVYVSSADGTLELGAASPAAGPRDRPPSASDLGVVLARGRADDGDEPPAGRARSGAMRPRRRWSRRWWPPTSCSASSTLRFPGERPADPEAREVATSIAGQAAIAVKNLQLIERLTEHNAIKDFLEDLSRGRPPPPSLADRGRGARLRPRPARTSCFRPLRARAAARRRGRRSPARSRRAPAARFRGRSSTAATAPCAGWCGSARPTRRPRSRACARCTPALNKSHPLAIGLSHRCEGAASFATGFEEAAAGGHGGGGHQPRARASSASTTSAPTSTCCGCPRTAARATIAATRCKKLEAYDRRHRSQLLATLEEYLKRRGNIAAAAQTLFVHPNTLRQRLRRIQDLTGLDVQNEDWLMIEIELKLLRLERALGRAASQVPGTDDGARHRPRCARTRRPRPPRRLE